MDKIMKKLMKEHSMTEHEIRVMCRFSIVQDWGYALPKFGALGFWRAAENKEIVNMAILDGHIKYTDKVAIVAEKALLKYFTDKGELEEAYVYKCK